MTRRSRLATRPRLEALDERLVLSAVTPAQIQAAYGLNDIVFGSGSSSVTGNGAGQTIAIIDAYNDPNAAAELATFDEEYGLPAAKLTVDNLGSASNTNSGWEEEEALDIEAAHLAAPGANIVLIEAKSDSTADLMAAVQVANNTAGVTVVSMSWGGSDSPDETQYDGLFTQAGITYLAASGDDGAGAEWPSDSPNVIAVGGTSLVASTSGRISETAWSDSGGGTSRVEKEPSYQDAAQSTGFRTTPDVSAVANPSTGLEMYSVAAGGWEQVGGTSLSTPIWAGLIAIADQGRTLEGKATLSSTQALGDLYEAPAGSFNDVTGGSRATTGFDTSTGLGTPNAPTLVAALVADPSTGVSTTGNGVGGDPLPTSTGTGTGTTGGTTGGGTTNPAPTPPILPGPPPFRGWGGYYTGYGFYVGPGGGWGGSYIPRNAGQETTDPFIPIMPIDGGQFATAAPPATTTITPRVELPAPNPEPVNSDSGTTTPGTSTPGTTTPGTTTPGTTNPVTPISSTPVTVAPVYSTPVTVTPVTLTPVSMTSVSETSKSKTSKHETSKHETTKAKSSTSKAATHHAVHSVAHR